MAYTIMISIQDEKGKTSTTELNVPPATAYDDVRIMAGQMATLIDSMISGAIIRIGIVDSVDLPAGIAAAPGAGSDVEEGARFQYRTANGFYSAMRLATFDESRIVAGAATVDLTDADVAAFVTAMTDGLDLSGAGGSGTIQPCDKRDEDLTALEFAREQFLSSRG
jgi:hypothetical protein